MRTNLPVTTIETLLPEGEFIYSSTDLKGIIVEANEAFAKISDFTREEMIGQPHNMVRHPDMPAEAFADLWHDLKAGRPWRGIVKNRRQDGGFYWVVANVSPIRENGSVIGYQSVRGRPVREEVEAAEQAYRRIKSGDQTIYIQHGRIVRRRPEWLNTLLSLRSQMVFSGLMALIASSLLLAIATGTTWIPAYLSVALAVITLLYSLYFLFYYTPSTNHDLQTTANWLEQILVSGNLRNRLDLDRRDIIGSIARKADKFISTAQATIQGIDDVAKQVENAARDVNSGMQSSFLSAQKQSEATSSAAASIEEITVSIGEVATHAAATMETAAHTKELSQKGTLVSQTARDKIVSLAETVNLAVEQIENLGQRSQEIGRVTSVIKEIADQTNLLALNAAIEAARAGETGRGFAVVADEVRKLAERTAKATQEIAEMTTGIQTETQLAVNGIRSGAEQVSGGVLLVNDAENALSEINDEMAKTSEMVSEISHASNEQQAALTELAQNVEKVATMTEDNVSVVNQTNATVNHLNSVVSRMRKAVTQYSV